MLEQVPIDDLQPGMYVNQVLERHSAHYRVRRRGATTDSGAKMAMERRTP